MDRRNSLLLDSAVPRVFSSCLYRVLFQTLVVIQKAVTLLRVVFPHAAALSVLLAILTAGLWPFHALLNEVEWLRTVPGLRFGEYAYIAADQGFPAPSRSREHTIEVQLEASALWNSNTLLTFYRLGSAGRFVLRQIGTGVEVDKEVRTGTRHIQDHMFLPHVFARSRITSL